MKGVVFLGDRKLELREFPDPTPGPRDVVLEVKASGMATCTTTAPRPIWAESSRAASSGRPA
jgi:threonine dehydrogenase-like Zn-dependent dehydrogenase